MKMTSKVKKVKFQIGRTIRLFVGLLFLLGQVFPNPSLAVAAGAILDPTTGTLTPTADATSTTTSSQTAAVPQTNTSLDLMSRSQTLSSTQTSSATPTISPSTTSSKSDITKLPDANIWRVAPSGNTSTVQATLRGLQLKYNTNVGGWAGAAFNFDNVNNAGPQTRDLSAMSQPVLGLDGNASKIKLEIIDLTNGQQHKTPFYLTGIRADLEQVWALSNSELTAAGVDLTKIYQINFIVEGSSQIGVLGVSHVPIPAITNASALTTEDVSSVAGVKGLATSRPTSNTTEVSTISGGLQVSYDTTVGGWAGGGYTFNDFTTSNIESQSLRDLSSLVIGLKGSTSRVRMDVVDDRARRGRVYLDGIRSDLTQVTQMFFIVEGKK